MTLLAPGTPMLFQGQEFGASSPFLFFADQNTELNKKIREGRAEFRAGSHSGGVSYWKKAVAASSGIATPVTRAFWSSSQK